MATEKRALRLLAAGFAALVLLTLWQWRGAAPLSSDLLALLPGAAQDTLRQRAEARVQEALNRELLILIGHPVRERAYALAERQAHALLASARFETLHWRVEGDRQALIDELLRGRLALADPALRELLASDPQRYLEQRAQALFSPLHGSPLPTERDWLGLAGQAAARLQQLAGPLAPDPQSGALMVEADGRHWVLLRLRTAADAFALDQAAAITGQLHELREAVHAGGGELLAAGGVLHAAEAQQRAAREIAWLGGGAACAVLALLLLVFRSRRALLALLPVLAGLASGTAACVALFGQIHLLTLVLGGSLIGVAIDYPLHLLSKRWSHAPWRSAELLRLTRPGLTLSLVSSLIGYLALAFSPFPALTQIALFSAAGLLAAYASTLALAPLLASERLQPWPPLLALASRLECLREGLLARSHPALLVVLLVGLAASGLSRLSLDNDLRQWVAPSPALLEEARRLAALTGHQPTSQFFLVEAPDESTLLARQQALAERLDRLVQRGALDGYLALSQRVAGAEQQQRLREALERLPAHWQALRALGVPQAQLLAERQALLQLPLQNIDAALAGASATAWRPLWLGPDGRGGVAGLITLRGLADARALAGLADGLTGVRLIDRVAELNASFAQTQRQAGALKLIACVLIAGLLGLVLGLRQSLRIVALPLLACALALAVLGWLGQPLTLLGLFGLLLVSALGVDYAILMHEGVGGAAVSLLGILLSGLTAWLSFGLLAFSATPAVADFGLTVSLGLAFSFLLAPWAGRASARQPLAEAVA